MIRINQVKLPVEHTTEALHKKVQELLKYKGSMDVEIVKRSLDARKKPQLFYVYMLDVTIPEKEERKLLKRCRSSQIQKVEPVKYVFPVKHYEGQKRPVIVGMGPAGLFCGYVLAKAGFRPILLERGKCVEERSRDVEAFWKTGHLNTESNVQFGEGGAGTFSDGKLNTLIKDKYGRNKEVLRIFVKHGAPKEILYDYKQYGKKEAGALGNAIYKLTTETSEKRGVYTFCMCPGGYVVNASSEEGRLAVNGMSYSGRNSANANSAVIITITPEDYGDSKDPLSGVAFQRKLEEKAYQIGNGKVPVERYGSFKRAFLGKKIHGFNGDEVLVEGIESRTSSPVRILRTESAQALGVWGLYPCGEGAGYAGGITSAAMDGIFVAEQLARALQEEV